MQARMKDRVGPRLSLRPTEQLKKEKLEKARVAPKSAPRARKSAPISRPLPSGGGVMSGKEKKRIARMNLELGDKLEISGHRVGILKFMGETEFAAGTMFGLELIDGALGDNSGTIDGVLYFECNDNRGVFISSKDIRKKCRKPKPKEPVATVYRRRLQRILEEFNPNKLKSLDGLLAKYEGAEHNLYVNVCKKYYVSPEKEYRADDM